MPNSIKLAMTATFFGRWDGYTFLTSADNKYMLLHGKQSHSTYRHLKSVRKVNPPLRRTPWMIHVTTYCSPAGAQNRVIFTTGMQKGSLATTSTATGCGSLLSSRTYEHVVFHLRWKKTGALLAECPDAAVIKHARPPARHTI